MPTFTPEQRRTLGMLYRFLIDLGQKRIRRLERVSSTGATEDNTCDEDQWPASENREPTSD